MKGLKKIYTLSPLKNVHFFSRPRKAKILTTPVRSAGPTGQADIHLVFRGLKFEPVDKSRSSGTQVLEKRGLFSKDS
jgi:hypothetical protein